MTFFNDEGVTQNPTQHWPTEIVNGKTVSEYINSCTSSYNILIKLFVASGVLGQGRLIRNCAKVYSWISSERLQPLTILLPSMLFNIGCNSKLLCYSQHHFISRNVWPAISFSHPLPSIFISRHHTISTQSTK